MLMRRAKGGFPGVWTLLCFKCNFVWFVFFLAADFKSQRAPWHSQSTLGPFVCNMCSKRGQSQDHCSGYCFWLLPWILAHPKQDKSSSVLLSSRFPLTSRSLDSPLIASVSATQRLWFVFQELGREEKNQNQKVGGEVQKHQLWRNSVFSPPLPPSPALSISSSQFHADNKVIYHSRTCTGSIPDVKEMIASIDSDEISKQSRRRPWLERMHHLWWFNK